jgi:hypothetical protein
VTRFFVPLQLKQRSNKDLFTTFFDQELRFDPIYFNSVKTGWQHRSGQREAIKEQQTR